MICDERLNISDNTAKNIIEQFFNFKKFTDLNIFWPLLKQIIEELFVNVNKKNTNMKLKIWMHIADNLPDCFNENILSIWKQNECAMVYRYCVWPLLNTMGNVVRTNKFKYVVL